MTRLQRVITELALGVAAPAAQCARHTWATMLAGPTIGSALQAVPPLLCPGMPRMYTHAHAVPGDLVA